MFRKVVSIIPFSPSYTQKLTQLESELSKDVKIRAIGVLLLCLLIIIECLITITNQRIYESPTQNSQNNSLSNPKQSETNPKVTRYVQVRNVTRETLLSDSTEADQGELLEYRLITNNDGAEKLINFTISIDLSDVLEYSDIIDASGASFSNTKNVEWSNLDLNSKGSITRTLLVRVRSPLPSGTPPSSNKLSFDNRLSVIYGNYSEAYIPLSTSGLVQSYLKQLPSVSKVFVVFITSIYTVLNIYYLLRSKVMLKELKLIKEQFNK